jgi:hypothetical protein
MRLVGALAVLGFVVGLSAFAAMRVSNCAIKRLKDLAAQHQGSSLEESLPVVGATHEDLEKWVQLIVPWNVLPWALMVIWPAVYLARVL